MGFLANTLGARRTFGPRDQELILNLVQVMNRVDGVVEPREVQLAEALARTVPQLAGANTSAAPTFTRKSLLDELGKLEDDGLRRQLFVICVEVALASGDINESEDQYADHLRRALKVDDAFARQVVEVVALKYARGVK